MFCPKCGTNAIEGTKFCRGCGMDLEAVSAVLNGKLSLTTLEKPQPEDGDDEDSNDVDKLWNSFVTNGFVGLAFLIISAVLAITGAANADSWWFWMLIPGFACLGSGVASYLKARRLERRQQAQTHFVRAARGGGNLHEPQFAQPSLLPPQQTVPIEFYQPPARDTGELVEPPASVTEHTTRHLAANPESETINLPVQK